MSSQISKLRDILGMKSRIFLLLGLLFLVSCSTPLSDQSILKNNEAIFIVKVNHPSKWHTITTYEDLGNASRVLHQSFEAADEYFIYQQTRASELQLVSYAPKYVSKHDSEVFFGSSPVTGNIYSPSRRNYSFETYAGNIHYIGDLSFRTDGGSLYTMSVEDNFQDAITYLNQNYPRLSSTYSIVKSIVSAFLPEKVNAN